ncbi:hypothetical protein CALVIDRAFT_63013 [Calocera viscosa TUFC12733]|uniref:Uncharacterized protein n=1 Tax=Calocera viscosa (strain TUFC12733) TaxID=1330018 RepID=A0A167NN42_CALVF|nr:hypothetical protein CALVIDRAFT_63013 [Calocera viscosa TUFC12733]
MVHFVSSAKVQYALTEVLCCAGNAFATGQCPPWPSAGPQQRTLCAAILPLHGAPCSLFGSCGKFGYGREALFCCSQCPWRSGCQLI